MGENFMASDWKKLNDFSQYDRKYFKKVPNTDKPEWFVYCRSFSNETHRREFYYFNILETNAFLEDFYKYIYKKRTFESVSKELYSLVFRNFYGAYEWEYQLDDWPLSISDEKLQELFEDKLNSDPDDFSTNYIEPESSIKVSVGEALFLNWNAFTSYVWMHFDTLKKMSKAYIDYYTVKKGK